MKDEQTKLAVEALKAAGCGVLAIHVQSRIEELEKDAARYRFAKSNKSQGKSDIVIVHKIWGGDQMYLSGDRADEVIDAAMQSNKGGI